MSSVNHIELSGSLDVETFPEVRQQLQDALSSRQAISISLASIERLDFIGLQLLISAKVSASRLGINFQLRGTGTPFLEACERFAVPLETF